MRTLKAPELRPSEVQSLLDDANKKMVRDCFTIRVVTPMVGGGVKPQWIDKLRPVRSSAIRGQLRFWWRATRGATYQNVAELRSREVEIFGSTERPSAVKIWVETDSSRIKSTPMFDESKKKMVREPWEGQYALFSFLGMKQEDPQYLNNFYFTLHVEYNLSESDVKTWARDLEELKLDVECALWAWINFGGIGSRTRRGCGSLYCSKFSPKTARADELRACFQEKVEQYKLNLVSHEANFQQTHREWPTLSTTIKFGGGETEPVKAWSMAVRELQKFRNARNEYKEGGTKRFSRSFWPEADSIRRITKIGVKDHLKSTTIKEGPDYVAFPRAQLGLPIIFHFQNDTQKHPPKDQGYEPSDIELVPKDRDRLASPVIVKAVAVENGFKAISAVVVLNQPRLGHLRLQLIQKKEFKKYIERKQYEASKRFNGKDIHPSAVYIAPEYLPEHRAKNPMRIHSNGQPTSRQDVTASAVTAFLNSGKVREWQWLNEN